MFKKIYHFLIDPKYFFERASERLVGKILKIDNPLKLNIWMLAKLKLQKNYDYTCQVRGTEIQIGVSSHLELFRCETYETKEPETLDWIEKFKEGELLFDIGANIGVYTLYAAKRKNCKVFAFEPESQNYARLVLNIYRNKLENVTPYCLAVSNTNSINVLHVTGMAAGDSQHSFASKNIFYNRNYSLLQGCISLSLDQMCFEFNLPIPNHIKIDVDGLEEEIIQGGMKVFAHPQVKSILIEITHKELELSPIFTSLKSVGFEPSIEAKRGCELPDNVIAKNYVFKRVENQVNEEERCSDLTR